MYFNKLPLIEYDFFGEGQTTAIPDIFRQVRTINKKFDGASPYQLYEIREERPDQLSYQLYGKTAYHWTFFIINDSLSGGLESWPMTYNQLQDHIDRKYANHTITLFRGRESGINDNSIAGKFEEGTIITGVTSNATATVIGRNPTVNQLVIRIDSGSFAPGEELVGSDSTSISGNYEIRAYKNSVAYYTDEEGRKYNNWENLYTPDSIVTYAEDEEIRNNERRYIRVVRKGFIQEFAAEYRRLING